MLHLLRLNRPFSRKAPTTAITTSTRQTSTMAGQHEAAILPQQGGPLSLGKRATPEPGPNDVLIEVKAVALNPCNHFQRDYGMPPVPIYPAIIGSDTAGVVAKLGSNVTTVPGPGSRVIAFASSFYQNGSPDHGSFQKYTLAQSEAVIPLPDNLSFEEGAVFPLAVLTALTAWTTIGIPLDTKHTPADKQAVLIWGASSSVGTFAVQSAKTLGFTVYATASPKHHDLVKKLGAHAVFDYRASDVFSRIVSAVKKDGTAIFEIGFHALRKKTVSRTLTQNTLGLTRIVSMQGLLRQSYAELFFQNTVTTSVLYT
ncbi:unnamed protein product [Penicillium egyptiacum]|uniref:Enoyl reductase (ER) domain-containing protein n=1 Tax=Penicillium egyptiacum TaxID=1303716 RepID=A0A9W4P5J9_9EURO|nr:unnamed protein product [Penicillium egyptiacum]